MIFLVPLVTDNDSEDEPRLPPSCRRKKLPPHTFSSSLSFILLGTFSRPPSSPARVHPAKPVKSVV